MIPATLAGNNSLDRWVAFGPGETVRILFGKVEYGQGNMTALAQIGAEELDVDWSRVIVEEPATGAAPDEGLTVGSMSIEMSGASVRQACAEVRQVFLDTAAQKLGCAVSELTFFDGAVLRGGDVTGLSYWTLDVDLKRPATGEVLPKKPADYRIVGQSLPRRDLAPKLFGAAFIHDLVPDGVVHARVLRQPGSSAKLVSLDESAIRKRAGAPIEIFREHEFVAFLSDSEAAAEAAVIEGDRIAHWSGARESVDTEAQALLTLPQETFEVGAAKGEPSNRRRITATYAKPYIAHGSMGPSCGLALWMDGRLTVWTHAQGVYPLRAMIAAGLAIPAEQIDVHHLQGPGNYGHNGSDDAAFDAALLALRHPGRTIRVQWRREDEFAHAPVGTAQVMTLTAELDPSGRIADYTCEVWSGPHTNRGRAIAERALPKRDTPPAPPPAAMAARPGFRFSGALLNATPSYDIAAARVVEHAITRPPVRTSSLRGLGGPPNEYAGECFVDELAEASGADPLAYRLAMLSNPRSRHVLSRLAELSSWEKRGAVGTGRGLGLAFCIHRGRGAFVACAADVSVDKDVRVNKVWCVADAGLIVNPDGAKNQIEGGIVMAASWVLKEQAHKGGVPAQTWDDYPILRFDEVPEVEIELVHAPEHPAMGIGEISSGPAMAAIGNAVAHALGTRIRDLPFTREKVAAALLT
jgi:CO/xanthine dehydrogenase Mo-binding subunit